jgi:hypothetical protein
MKSRASLAFVATLLLSIPLSASQRAEKPAAIQPVLIVAFLEAETIHCGDGAVLHVILINQSNNPIIYAYAAMMIGEGRAFLLSAAEVSVGAASSEELVFKIEGGTPGRYQCAAALGSNRKLPADAIVGAVAELTVTCSSHTDVH